MTLWFKPQLSGPVAIEFDATAIKARGRNDRGADLNTFWMAGNSDGSAPVFSLKRTGRTSEYDSLRGYFASLGGDNNTRSRFLRYAGERPRMLLDAEHELSTQDALLPANRSVTVTLVASGGRIEYWRNTKRLFEFNDEQPLRQGWFAIRTMQSHLKISRLRIYALEQPR